MIVQTMPSVSFSWPSTMSCGPIPTSGSSVCLKYLKMMFMFAISWICILPLFILPNGRSDVPESTSSRWYLMKEGERREREADGEEETREEAARRAR